MGENRVRTGMRSVEVVHYEPGVRRSLEFAFDGMDTVDVVLKLEIHGQRPALEVSAGMPLDEEEIGKLIAKLVEIRAQMEFERKQQEEWEKIAKDRESR